MGLSGLVKLGSNSVELTEDKYETLIREREQLRILKNFINQESTLTKNEIINLINAMDQRK